MRIAILQNDASQSAAIKKILVNAGHSCVVFDDGLTLSKARARSTVDLLVLDWKGVRMSGIEVLKTVRAVGGDRLPVIFASGDASEESMVQALSLGADDYVTLPVIRPAEFRERVSALLRRSYPERCDAAGFIVGPYQFDAVRQRIRLHGELLPLSGTQYRLASLFFSNLGRILSRDHIFAMVWGREFREATRTIDSHVSRLRLVLEIEPKNGFRLQSVYKSGYRMLRLSDLGQDIEEMDDELVAA
ncbi:response regulator transcription factor [Paraburkholderia bonniea]|uniref:response regulator transcription factor n=1 Tax=Paraburkholderia bonniea TaxID=2152891 RepID=UPI00129199A7|nr:response regulator transcription factor [Paraburkholderia bonniea]WJF92050.1 response regulator transcription factor [Paraburkholderia bonniea]WJF95370.1 response regulator transcription factor [Paraburkholderia bonniea]